MDKLFAAIWQANPTISSHGYRAFPVNNRYVVLYLDPDEPKSVANITVRPDIKYVDTVSNLIGAAALIQQRLGG